MRSIQTALADGQAACQEFLCNPDTPIKTTTQTTLDLKKNAKIFVRPAVANDQNITWCQFVFLQYELVFILAYGSELLIKAGVAHPRPLAGKSN